MDNSYDYNLRNMRKRASGIVNMEEKVAAKRQTHISVSSYFESEIHNSNPILDKPPIHCVATNKH